MTVSDGVLGSPRPARFLALTRNSYSLPFSRPLATSHSKPMITTRLTAAAVTITTTITAVWRSGSAFVSINEVNLRRARLVMSLLTVSVFSSRCGTSISICNQPPRSTQPGHPIFSWVGAVCTSQRMMTPCGWGGTVRVWVASKTVCSPCYTHGPCLECLSGAAR